MNEAASPIPIDVLKIREDRVDGLRAWAADFAAALRRRLPLVGGQIRRRGGSTILRLRVDGHVSEIEIAFQVNDDPSVRADAFLIWAERNRIESMFALADDEPEPLVERIAAAAWATASDAATLDQVTRASASTSIRHKEGLRRRVGELSPFSGAAVVTDRTWTDQLPYRTTSRAVTRVSITTADPGRGVAWRISDNALVIPRMVLPETILAGIHGMPLGSVVDQPTLALAGATIEGVTADAGGMRIELASDLIPVSEAVSWLRTIAPVRAAA